VKRDKVLRRAGGRGRRKTKVSGREKRGERKGGREGESERGREDVPCHTSLPGLLLLVLGLALGPVILLLLLLHGLLLYRGRKEGGREGEREGVSEKM